jgi:C-terminal processing protease CtpA/Prc
MKLTAGSYDRISDYDARRMTKLALTLLISSLVALTALGAERGVIGVSVRGEPDFRVIASVVPDGPAARADIRVGHQIVAIGNVPTLKIRTVEEFLRKVSGPPGSEIELQLKRPQTDSLIRVRLRRVAPATLVPPKIPADFERYQTRSRANGVRSLGS